MNVGPPTVGGANPSRPAESPDLRARAWVLLALDSLSRNGLTPISKLRFHRFVYLTNALSPLYRVQAADERIVKFKRGQFYPDMQWHLDRLMSEGLARVSNVRYFDDADGPWMEADYRLGKLALPALVRISALDEMRELSEFLQEIAKAYAAQDDTALDDLILSDVTYGDMRRARGTVIDFSRADDNLSVQTANAFGLRIRDSRKLSASDRVHLYVEYIDQLNAGLARRA